jgi:putative FmdB family regulatory protein
MAVYEYRCQQCGVFEAQRPMGTAGLEDCCPACGALAPRAYSAPFINRTPEGIGRVVARAEKSRDELEVVRTVPPRRGVRPRPTAVPKGLPRW